MPKWGLTPTQIRSEPWGLPSSALEAKKTITNSIEKDVYLNALEVLILDSPPVQRLRRVRQLGTSHGVYPDATHSRFGHALGALRIAQDLLDAAIDQAQRPHALPDLFQEWADTLSEEERDRRIAEATVLARLGALLHDLCHVPFGHSLEDDLGLLERHDYNEARFGAFWSQLNPHALELIGPKLREELHWLILSKADSPRSTPSNYPWVEDIVGNTICADLLDYLPRDHQNLGLPLALGHRFLDSLLVTPSTHPEKQQRVIIQVVRDGHERSDVISELLKVLRYRYEESERVLFHHAKLATDAMVAKVLAMWRDSMWVDEVDGLLGPDLPDAGRHDVDELRRWVAEQPETTLRQALPSPQLDTSVPIADTVIAHVDERVQQALEHQMQSRGDDGLLEHLALDLGLEGTDSRRAAISTLAANVLDRQLYKPLGRSLDVDRAEAERIWEEWGNKDARRRLELESSRYVGLDEGWHVVVWIPRPDMKLKPAQVLVGLDNQKVRSLEDHSERCKEIYEAHRALWSVSVFGHASVLGDPLRHEVLLAWLAERLRITGWERHAQRTKEEIAVEHFCRTHDLTVLARDELLTGVSGLGVPPKTLSALLDELQALHRATGT